MKLQRLIEEVYYDTKDAFPIKNDALRQAVEKANWKGETSIKNDGDYYIIGGFVDDEGRLTSKFLTKRDSKSDANRIVNMMKKKPGGDPTTYKENYNYIVVVKGRDQIVYRWLWKDNSWKSSSQ